ncbi:hypothetical protein [Gemelliphila asaccharolytica]|uniref:Uncharacterized protein n=1 Tax=Gemelliphila asaccharolytica TaxID=502393 RepID=A0ABR5TNH4_9BACL|nr:hypothetical protein [Gemella asaccharolytica]KXB58972.1 hypothetical protein HMPREF1871_00039 [Gemella asaccharolytica]
MNNKKMLMLVGAGILLFLSTKSKDKKFSESELEKIKSYSEYLDDRGFVVVDKNNYKKDSTKKNILTSIPKYYYITKKIIKFLI